MLHAQHMKTKKGKSLVKKSPVAKQVSKTKTVRKKAHTKASPIPSGREHQLAEQALKFVDEAASLLRTGIREGAATTAKSRIAAKKKAHDLLGKASTNLSKVIEESASVLQNLLKKI